ncbi:BQ5605_C005g03210 [Microbotryum silenes-dioicae]|uniref:BQ5605_C005g03210 protein n=1 Tax=Microbotryum silenes-dioicae TaxID=796604 RepID=A0A2X0MEN6_9BASI|nr:BQ5605_C005g03210 [Microbotryum silenes-dioicae]
MDKSIRSAPSTTATPLPAEFAQYLFTHRNLFAAATASFVSTIAGFPLDSIKARIQVKRYSGVLDCARCTFAEEGVAGFFRGVGLWECFTVAVDALLLGCRRAS